MRPGLFVSRRGRKGRVVYGKRRDGRISFLAVTRRRQAVRTGGLVRTLRSQGLLRR